MGSSDKHKPGAGKDKGHDKAAAHGHADHGHGHGHDHDHPHYLQHHFDTPEQQADSEKLGMWLFLVTEILLFGGLFCAYAWYRANHPEVFMYAHQLLDPKWGMINTIVLIFSSFTMAIGVRAAQMGQKSLMMGMLAITVLCAFAFMGIKSIEYEAKFSHGAVWSKSPAYDAAKMEHYVHEMHSGHSEGHGEGGSADGHGEAAEPVDHALHEHETAHLTLPTGADGLSVPQYQEGEWIVDASLVAPAPEGPGGLSYLPGGAHEVPKADHHEEKTVRPPNTHIFFGIYFVMTGLHGIHVLIGIIAIVSLMYFGAKGVYTPEYNTPVDMVGLYWHIVDLIWIFLFPLLYLIH